MDRDYQLNFRVDASQGGPQLAKIRTDLRAIRGDLDDITRGATNASTAMGQLGTAGGSAGTTITTAGDGAARAWHGLGTQVFATAAAFKALELGVDLVGKIGEKINTAREHMKELAEETMKTRAEMRELANLKGKDGPDDSVAGGAVHFGMKAGMMPTQARAFLEQYLGSSPAGVQKGNVGDGRRAGETQQQYEKRVAPIMDEIAREGARFGQRVGLTPQTAGDITGVLSQHGRVKDGNDAAQRLGRIAYGLNDGRGKLEPLMRSLTNTAGALVGEGIVESDEDLAVMLGAMSTTHGPTGAGTYLKKGVRELRQSSGTQGFGLEQMGITPQDKHLDAVRKAAKYMEGQEKLGKAKDQTLRELGFMDEAAIQAIVEEVKSLPVVDQRLQNMQAVTGGDVRAKNDRFFTRNLAGAKMMLDADKAGKDFDVGAGREAFQLARVQAVQRMRDSGQLADGETKFGDMIADMGGILPWMGVPTAMSKRIDQNAFEHLKTQAERNGMGGEFARINDGNGFWNDNWWGKGDTVGPKLFGNLVPKLLDKGVDFYGEKGDAEGRVQARADGLPYRPKLADPAPKKMGGKDGKEELHKVLRVLDGDTIEVDIDGRAVPVRMVGVDTPETVHPTKGVQPGGVAASNYTKKQLTGTEVILRDNAAGDKLDKYGRRLSYVHRPDGSDYNKELIEKGFGKPYLPFNFDRKQEYIDAGARAGKGGNKPTTQADGNLEGVLRAILAATVQQTGELRNIARDGGGLPTSDGFGPRRA